MHYNCGNSVKCMHMSGEESRAKEYKFLRWELPVSSAFSHYCSEYRIVFLKISRILMDLMNV